MRRSTWVRLGLVAGALALSQAAAPAALACPNCKEAVASQGASSGNVAAGYSRSVLLLIGMPFALLGLGTAAVVRLARRGGIPQL